MMRRVLAGCLALLTIVPLSADQIRSADDQTRFDRAVDVASRRLDEWLGPSGANPPAIQLNRAFRPASSSMDMESQIAFQIARARLSRIANATAMVDGLAWHLQSRIVEELFDYEHHQPGHHAEEVRLFGNHVRWGVPLLVLSGNAHDERVSPELAQRAAAIATLERLVGWPALAGAVRVLASDVRPQIDGATARSILESALGVPLDWLDTALQPGFHMNLSLRSVSSETAQCAEGQCYRAAIGVSREGQAMFAAGTVHPQVPILIDFGGERQSTLRWNADDPSHIIQVESSSPPIAVTLDPDRVMRVDDNPLDQRWQATPSDPARPIKLVASWLVWLQNAVLTSAVLL